MLEFLLAPVMDKFTSQLSLKAKLKSLQFFLVIPPHHESQGHGRELFSAEHFNYLKDKVDGFSLMTYDYSNPQK